MFFCPCLKTEKIYADDTDTPNKLNASSNLFNKSKIDFFKRRGSRNPSDIKVQKTTPRIRGQQTILEIGEYEESIEESESPSPTQKKQSLDNLNNDRDTKVGKGIGIGMLDPSRPIISEKVKNSQEKKPRLVTSESESDLSSDEYGIMNKMSYQKSEVLYRDSVKVVYKCLDPRSGRAVVIKSYKVIFEVLWAGSRLYN